MTANMQLAITSNVTYDKINIIISAKEAMLGAIVENGDIARPESLFGALYNTQPFTRVKHLVDSGLLFDDDFTQ